MPRLRPGGGRLAVGPGPLDVHPANAAEIATVLRSASLPSIMKRTRYALRSSTTSSILQDVIADAGSRDPSGRAAETTEGRALANTRNHS